jgi:hypothetical protein
MMNNNNFNPMAFNMMLNMMNVMYPNMGYNQNNYNFNMNNNAFLMNSMMNWMNMNPNLLMMYNIMMNQNKNMNNNFKNQSNNSNNKFKLVNVSQEDLNQAKVTGGGIIPKNLPNNSLYNISSPFDNSMKANVTFTTQRGQKMNIICPMNMKMKDLFIQYVIRLGLGPNVIGDSLFFLFNGAKIPKMTIEL